MCQSVDNHSNAKIKQIELWTIHRNKCSKCLPLALEHALNQSRYWSTTWSIRCVGFLATLQSDAASAHQRSSLLPINTFLHHSPYLVVHRIDVKTVGRPQFCVSLVHLPVRAPTRHITTKQYLVLSTSLLLSSSDVRGVPLPGCQSAVPVSRIFRR